MRLAKFVREERIEIVHAHMARDYPLAMLAARGDDRARLIITRHVLFPLRKIHRLTLSRVARIIAVSEPLASSLRAQSLFPDEKIVTIPNGIEAERFDKVEREASRQALCNRLQIGPRQLLIGTLGELNPLKGHEEFLRAAELITHARDDVHFIIAGSDSSPGGAYQLTLERLIDELGLHGRAHLLGWVDEVPRFLKGLDVFVSASHTESFGLAIVEAMAAGLAVVATATEGARSVLEEEVTGLLVPVGDVEAMAASVSRLLSDGDERERLSARAHEAARSRFSLERMVNATEQVYMEALVRQ